MVPMRRELEARRVKNLHKTQTGQPRDKGVHLSAGVAIVVEYDAEDGVEGFVRQQVVRIASEQRVL